MGNTWTIDVQDFQSIKKAHIEIPDGLTVITGKTNSGKSAILRSIDCALFNTGTDDLVRSGKKIAGVTISNGSHSMTYCRNAVNKNEKTAYQFDGGSVQKKVGRAQLPEVVDLFGITDVRMQNNVRVKLNFWYQNDKPFLMDKTPGQLYEFLSLSSADKYFKILKSMKADIKVQEAEINNSNATIDTLKSINNAKQEFIDNNKGFDELYVQVITAGQEADRVNRQLSIIENLERIKNQIDVISQKLSEVSKKYDSIPFGDISTNYSILESKNKDYEKLHTIAINVGGIRKGIQQINSSLSNVNPKYGVLEEAVDYVRPNLESILYVGGFVNRSLTLIDNCRSFSSKIDAVKQRIIEIDSKNIDISSLDSYINDIVSKGETCTKFEQMVTSTQNLNNRVVGVSEKISVVFGSIESKEKELEEFKSQVGYCPFCGSVFDKNVGHSH